MVKLNYFDLGLYKDAAEVDMFISICKKNGFKYNVYGFEAHPNYCVDLINKYIDNNNVKIFNKAISNINGRIKLYISKSNDGEGNSIFKTKNNVCINDFIEVDTIKFSDWIEKNVKNFKYCNNILRFNIEGAEWYLINDLNDNDLLKYFKVILGSKPDMIKVRELSGNIKKYESILKKNNIVVRRFTKVNPQYNCNLLSLINELFKEIT